MNKRFGFNGPLPICPDRQVLIGRKVICQGAIPDRKVEIHSGKIQGPGATGGFYIRNGGACKGTLNIECLLKSHRDEVWHVIEVQVDNFPVIFCEIAIKMGNLSSQISLILQGLKTKFFGIILLLGHYLDLMSCYQVL